jgi:GT2 family glycosyltransferase
VLARYHDAPAIRVVALDRNVGVPAARNIGVAQSHSDIIVFLDADAYAPAQWLGRLVAPFSDPAIAGTGGPDRAPPNDRPFALAVDYSLQSWIATGRLRLTNPFTGYVPAGCNFAIRRSVVNEVGGFDERLNRRGEEKELIVRIHRGGHHIAYCADALIWHRRRASPKQFWRQNFLSGVARIDIMRIAPDAFSWPHIAPGLLVLALLAAMGHLAIGRGEEIAAGVLAIYVLLLLFDGFAAATGRRYRHAAHWVPLTTGTIHWGYGAGLIVGFLRWLGRRPVGKGAGRTSPIVGLPTE